MKVLVLEQNPESRQLVARTLRSADFAVELVDSPATLAAGLTSQPQSIVAVGWSFRQLLTRPAFQPTTGHNFSTYFILLMEAGCSVENVKEGLRCGADDFVFYPQNGAELIMRVGIAERILNLKSTHRELNSVPLTAPKFQKRKASTPATQV
jgi:DNA-binding response OmpR family regulator